MNKITNKKKCKKRLSATWNFTVLCISNTLLGLFFSSSPFVFGWFPSIDVKCLCYDFIHSIEHWTWLGWLFGALMWAECKRETEVKIVWHSSNRYTNTSHNFPFFIDLITHLCWTIFYWLYQFSNWWSMIYKSKIIRLMCFKWKITILLNNIIFIYSEIMVWCIVLNYNKYGTSYQSFMVVAGCIFSLFNEFSMFLFFCSCFNQNYYKNESVAQLFVFIPE